MIRRATLPQHQADMTNWYWFPTGFSKEEIEMVHNLSKLFNWQEGVTFGRDHTDEDIRKSRIKWLNQYSTETEWLYDKLFGMAEVANKELWNFNLYSSVDSVQYTEYQEGGGHYAYHVDIGGGEGSLRKLSMVVQLSDPADYDGGQFELLRGMAPEQLPNQQGAVIVFPSYLLHRVTPVTKGTRNSLVMWVGGEHYK
jgi:PKHD-type hydroxylase